MKQHYFSQFTKVNESVQPESLKPDELVRLDNMRLDDKIAAAVTRKGFDRYNKQVSSSGAITSIFDVEDLDGNNQLLAQIGTVLRKSLNGSEAYSTIKTGLTNAKLRKAIYGDNFYFTNGHEEPFYTDLTPGNTFNFSIETPDVTGMTYTNNSVPSTGDFQKFRRYILQYITADGQVSNPSIYFLIDYTQDATDYGSKFDLANIPVPTDSRVISKKLYRTKANQLNNFYLIATLKPDVTTYSDTGQDTAFLAEEDIEYITPINWSKYIATNAERIFLGNLSKVYTNRVIAPGYNEKAVIDWSATGGNVIPGTYTWGISYVDLQGNESAITEVGTETITFSPRSVKISDIALPITRAYEGGFGSLTTSFDFDESIKSIKLYRTKVNTSTPYFLVKDYGMNELNWDISFSPSTIVYVEDNLADSSLGAQYNGTDSGGAESVTLKSTVVFSNPFAPIEVEETNLIQVYPDDNDAITGIFDDDNGVVVFKQRSICKIFTNGDPTNWHVTKLIKNVGCDEPNSIYKYGTNYFFHYKQRPYIFDGRSVVNIGESRRNTFDSVESIKGATFWHKAQFYILSVTIGDAYYLMVYDTKLKTWYKWTVSKADALTTKLFGDDKDTILLGRDTYITYYNESLDYDNDTGTRTDIWVTLKTKDYRIDGFENQRLWMLYVDYRKRLDRVKDNIVFTLTDPDKPSTTLNYNDNNSLATINKFKIPTDAMIGILKRARVINFSFVGVSMDKFINARLDFMPEPWGVERRDSGAISGLGVAHGSEAGVSD